MAKHECIAMLLAGGQGTRLEALTKNIAKPAVPFGGKYRLIDFALSNCTNSGISTVGILTQYKPLVLNSYIGIGIPWDLDRKDGGVFVLPPYVTQQGGNWYKGTANSVYQNMDFIERFNPDYVLILSGDHVYKMNYSIMLDYHKKNNAELTISVIEVPWEEASRFGIMNVNKDGSICEFNEKPEAPKSNLASMGIYIINWSTLKEYLIKDEENPKSSNDFGKDIIPKMLNDNRRLYAYKFKGYWRDVGTVTSLWQANMDLLNDKDELNLYDKQWRIYSVNPLKPPQYLSEESKVSRSLISEGCIVNGEVIHSVLFPGVHVGKGTVIKDSVIMPKVEIGEDVNIEKAIIGRGSSIENRCKIGDFQGENCEVTLVAEYSNVVKDTVIYGQC